MSIQYKNVTAYVNGKPIEGVESVTWSTHSLYKVGYEGGLACGAALGVARMRSLALDFEAMAAAMRGVPSHWAAQMANALRVDADKFEREVRGG